MPSPPGQQRTPARAALVPAILLLLAACGAPPLSPEEKARIEARVAEEKATRAREKERFEAEVVRRIAADPAAPERVPDHGYPAGTCVSPWDDAISEFALPEMGSIGIGGGVVCDNTAAGRRVLTWREWFCQGFETEPARVRDCVLAWWQDGYRAPRAPPGGYGYTVDTAYEITITPEASFIVKPPTWQPQGD